MLIDFRIFWDGWNLRNMIHVFPSKVSLSKWFKKPWVHPSRFTGVAFWRIQNDQAVWDVLISMLIIYSAGGGLSWWSCRSIGKSLKLLKTPAAALPHHLFWSLNIFISCPVYAGFSGAFSFLLPRRGWRSSHGDWALEKRMSGMEQKEIWCPER